MKSLLGKLGMIFSIVAAVGMIGQTSASALACAAVTGQGTISPGLTTTSTPQSFTFSTIVAVGVTTKPAAAAGQISCTFTGSSTGGETSATGQGTGSGTCSGAVSASCTISYSRTGPVVTVSGSCSVGGVPQGITGVFVFVPTSAPTVSSYVLAGGSLLL